MKQIKPHANHKRRYICLPAVREESVSLMSTWFEKAVGHERSPQGGARARPIRSHVFVNFHECDQD
jgi:hypothetical protein